MLTITQPIQHLVRGSVHTIQGQRPTQHRECLVHASELLHCVIATAYESGDSLKGSSRDLAFSILHLVQMASVIADQSLDGFSTR
jgi:hypothetical protein